MSALRQSLIRALRLKDPTPDTALLRAAADGEHDAFPALVARHGPMVLRVCEHVLRDRHAAEDAFQAVFLLLSRRLGRLHPPERVAAWLFGAARRIALNARKSAMRRLRRETRSAPMMTADSLDQLTGRELMIALEEEIERLPEVYRLPLLLCYWQGLKQEEVARRLGWSAASVKGRLERGRARLNARLTQRGLAPSILLVAAGTPAIVSAELIAHTSALALPGAAMPAGVAAALATTGTAKSLPALAAAMLLVGAGAIGIASGTGLSQAPAGKAPDPPSAPTAMTAAPRIDRLGDALPEGALMRLGTLRHRTSWPINRRNRVYLPDGRTLLTAYEDIRLSDVDSGREIGRWAHPAGLKVLGISPNGQSAILANEESVEFWDLARRKEVRVVPSKAQYLMNAQAWFASDGKHVLLVEDTQNARHQMSLWTAGGAQGWRTDSAFPQGRQLAMVRFRPDGRTLAVHSLESQTAAVLDRATGQVIRSFAVEGAAAMSEDGSTLVTATERSPVRLWDLNTGLELRSFGTEEQACGPLGFSADGARLATGGPDGTVLIYDWKTQLLAQKIKIGEDTPQWVGFTPDGKRLEGAHFGESLTRFWDVASGNELPPPEGHTQFVSHVRFGPTGTVVTAGMDRTVRTWDAATGRCVRSFRLADVKANEIVLGIAADGRTILTGSRQRPPTLPLKLLDAHTGRKLAEVGLPGVSPFRCAISPNRRLVAAGEFDSNSAPDRSELRVWNVESGEAVHTLIGPEASALAFSPDSRLLAATSWNSLCVWDVASGQLVLDQPVNSGGAAFASDGRSIACYCRQRQAIRVYEVATGNLRQSIASAKSRDSGRGPNPGNFGSPIEFSPDGRFLASWNDYELFLWGLSDGQLLARLDAHRGGIESIAFSPDGRTLATAGWDTVALLWTVPEAARPVQALSESNADDAWTALESDDAAAAYRAMIRIEADSAAAVTMFRNRLRPIAAVEAAQIAGWCKELDDPRFAVREAAGKALEQHAESAIPALRELLAGKPSPEARQRAEQLLKRLDGPHPAPQVVRQIRAVEVLERIATSAARELLSDLAKGNPRERLTGEAKASLERLKVK